MAMPEWEKKLLAQLRKDALRKGDSDSMPVRRWRARLRSKGFVVAKTGDFDQPLKNATRVAQIAAGVEADGAVGPITWKAVGKLKPAVKPKPRPKPKPGWKPTILDCRHGRNGFPVHTSKRWGKRSLSSIRYTLGHYTGNLVDFLNDARFHVNTSYLDAGGAPALAYTLGVDVSGRLLVFNEWNDVTWHCDGGFNTATLGIAFQGGEGGPNVEQRRTLKWLFEQLEAGTFQPPGDAEPWPLMPKRKTSHRHVRSTSCPGEKGEAFYSSLGFFVTRPRL